MRILAYCRTKNPTCTAGRDGFLVHFYIVRIVDDVVELSEPSIVEYERCRLLLAVFHVTLSVHVGDGLPVARIPQQLHGVRDDGLVWMDVSLTPGSGHCIAEPPEARNRFVLDVLIDVRHLESVAMYHRKRGMASKILSPR